MSIELSKILRNKAINEWNLFWLITGPTSIAMLIAMLGTDLSSGEGVSSMIQLSVRCAIPWLYLAFAASSLQVLFPGQLNRWLLRNRKIIGLCFAAAMSWQLLFILWLVTVYSDYYIAEVYVLRDVIEGVLGYLFLGAMTLTSFRFGRQYLKPRQWKWLHKSGIYFLWAYAFGVYWWALFHYQNAIWLDYVYYWSGLSAWAVRAAAWSKKRRKRDEKNAPQISTPLAFKWIGAVIIGFGLIGASYGAVWREPVEGFLLGTAITRPLELYFPYWPFTPFLPLFVIALGTFLMTRLRA
jgi:hypothetical protein